MWDQVPQLVVSLIVGLLGGGALLTYIKDRKKSSAEGSVAEQTIEMQVDVHRMQNLESRFALAERAWDEERASLQRRVLAAEERETRLELDLEKKEREILALRAEVARIEADLTDVSRRLADMSKGDRA